MLEFMDSYTSITTEWDTKILYTDSNDLQTLLILHYNHPLQFDIVGVPQPTSYKISFLDMENTRLGQKPWTST